MARQACVRCASWPEVIVTIVKDLTRVMSRLKALYRSWSLCRSRDVYYTRHRAEWLGKIPETGLRRQLERRTSRTKRSSRAPSTVTEGVLRQFRYSRRKPVSLSPIRLADAV
jgi:hypothetical protein